MNDKYYMQRAIELAKQAAEQGEVPVGAVLVDSRTGEVAAEAHNTVETDGDATAHAELLVIRKVMMNVGGRGGEDSMSEQEPSAREAPPHGASSRRAPEALNNNNRLSGYDLYVTLEPCAMCAGAISHARIRRLVFGAYDPKSGGVEHGPKVFSHATTHHKPEVIGGVEEQACSKLLTDFFESLR